MLAAVSVGVMVAERERVIEMLSKRKGRVTKRHIGDGNWYEICIDGKPVRKANGEINAERQANLIRRKQGKRPI